MLYTEHKKLYTIDLQKCAQTSVQINIEDNISIIISIHTENDQI